MVVAFIESTSGVDVKSKEPNCGVSQIAVTLPITFVWGTDTIGIDLAKHGGSELLGVHGWAETTAGSVLEVATYTSEVATTTATISPDSSSSATCGGTLIFTFK